MKAAEKLSETKVTLHGLAVEYYRRADGRISEARAALLADLSGDKKLLAAVVTEAIASAIGHTMHGLATSHRNKIFKAATTPASAGRANVIALATGMEAAMMDWPLANGLKLRNATRADLLDSIERYSAQAGALQTRAVWLEHVLQSLPDDDITVGERLSEERLKELYGEVAKS